MVHRPGSKFEQCEAQSAASIFKASLMARAATSLMKDQLLPKLQQLYNRSRQVQYQQVEDVENNNYSCVNNNLLELPEPSSPSLRRWQRWSRNLVGLNCLFVPTPRRYMAIPRTPVQTDKLELHQAITRSQAEIKELPQPADLERCTSRGGCTPGSSGNFGSTYGPVEHLVQSA